MAILGKVLSERFDCLQGCVAKVTAMTVASEVDDSQNPPKLRYFFDGRGLESAKKLAKQMGHQVETSEHFAFVSTDMALVFLIPDEAIEVEGDRAVSVTRVNEPFELEKPT